MLKLKFLIIELLSRRSIDRFFSYIDRLLEFSIDRPMPTVYTWGNVLPSSALYIHGVMSFRHQPCIYMG